MHFIGSNHKTCIHVFCHNMFDGNSPEICNIPEVTSHNYLKIGQSVCRSSCGQCAVCLAQLDFYPVVTGYVQLNWRNSRPVYFLVLVLHVETALFLHSAGTI